MSDRIYEEAGVGLVELLIAMTVLSVGIFALVAGFSSGQVTLERASSASSAASVADAAMEGYRALKFGSITATCLEISTCAPVVTEPTAGDGRKYRMEISIGHSCPVGSLGGTVSTPTCTSPASQVTKLVRIVIKNLAGTKTLYTQSSTFAKMATG